jgi:hypothetical protein
MLDSKKIKNIYNMYYLILFIFTISFNVIAVIQTTEKIIFSMNILDLIFLCICTLYYFDRSKHEYLIICINNNPLQYIGCFILIITTTYLFVFINSSKILHVLSTNYMLSVMTLMIPP